jgi:hypothetical protein
LSPETDKSGKKALFVEIRKMSTMQDIGPSSESDCHVDPASVSRLLSLAKYGISQHEILTNCGPVGSLDAKSFVDYLVLLGLIHAEKQPLSLSSLERLTMFYTTEKGFRFLRSYHSLVELAGGSLK